MTGRSEKLDLRSRDLVEDQRQELLRLFPEIRTEGGKIDFDRLKLALGESVDAGKERYGLNWPGKADCFKTIQAPSLGTLLPCPEESINFDTTENLIIEGDNLEVLKLLQKSYLGKVKMIYIDPPYNTGNDFIYPDNYAESLQTYLEYTGQVDSEGRKFSTNTDTDGRFHSKWLNMMYPRLYLARNLLTTGGVIFISIDDTELCNLKQLCDQVFGEENFVACNVWQKRYSRDNRPVIGAVHDYILLYARDVEGFAAVRNLLPPNEESTNVYRNPNNDQRGRWRPIPMTAQGTRANQMYQIITPAGVVHEPPKGRCWSMIEPQYLKLLAQGRIWFGADGRGQPNVIRYLSEVEGFVPWTWWPHTEVGHTDYPTIADMTKERVRRVIKKLNQAEAGQLPLNGVQEQDRGFRGFKLAESNFRPWNAQVAHNSPALEQQLEMHIDHIRDSRTADDILYEILLKSGFPLTTPVEALTLAGKTVHSVAGGMLFICLERKLTMELIRAMAERKPERVVCLDEGFAGNDQLKANAVQILRTRGVNSFKTV